MRAVWDAQPRAVRVRDVLEAVNARRRAPLAYNTVQTMLTILRDKGVVQVTAPGNAEGGGGAAHTIAPRSRAMRHRVTWSANWSIDCSTGACSRCCSN